MTKTETAGRSKRVGRRTIGASLGALMVLGLVLGGCARGDAYIAIDSEPREMRSYLVPESRWDSDPWNGGEGLAERLRDNPRLFRPWSKGDTLRRYTVQLDETFLAVVFDGDSVATRLLTSPSQAGRTESVLLSP